MGTKKNGANQINSLSNPFHCKLLAINRVDWKLFYKKIFIFGPKRLALKCWVGTKEKFNHRVVEIGMQQFNLIAFHTNRIPIFISLFSSIKLLSILNILCNNTQTTSIQQRDACYGCFFRAGNLPPGNVQLVSLSQCATIYLNNTVYQQCAAQLQVCVVYNSDVGR